MATSVLFSVSTEPYRAAAGLHVVVREDAEAADLRHELEVHVTAEVPVAVRGIRKRVGTAFAVQRRRSWRPSRSRGGIRSLQTSPWLTVPTGRVVVSPHWADLSYCLRRSVTHEVGSAVGRIREQPCISTQDSSVVHVHGNGCCRRRRQCLVLRGNAVTNLTVRVVGVEMHAEGACSS
jgi:hypothetical protein